jgi:DNA-binding Xre family transcriptional regulator
VARFLQQQELANLVGFSRRKLQILKSDQVEVVDFRDLVNLAIALRCQIGDIIDPRWLEWKPRFKPPTPPPDSDGQPLIPPLSSLKRPTPTNHRIAKTTKDQYRKYGLPKGVK